MTDPRPPVPATVAATAAPATRRVADALGELQVDAHVLWGAQTQRALQHFAIGTQRMPHELLAALVRLKGLCARVNGRLGRLPAPLAQALETAAAEVLGGGHAGHFPLSPWQSGSGTQSHMNVNEVLARLAELRLAQHAGGDTGSAPPAVHPNDHVNLGQSSNDMMPSALHVAVALAVRQRLRPALLSLMQALAEQAARHAELVKLGRTHLQDAVPMTLGQEIGAWRSQLQAGLATLDAAEPALWALALGGTAVGTGLNAPPGFAEAVCAELAADTGIDFHPAPDRFAALSGREPLVALHGALKVLAVALVKIANDLRLLGSGPRAGLGELVLPANEPGSSIMPGKVNPTQCEALVMVGWQVIGHDTALTLGAAGGHLQLNTALPLLAVNLFGSLELLEGAMRSFEVHTVRGLVPDAARIGQLLSQSLMLVTALTPHIGYDRAARIAHHAHAERLTLREAALADGVAAADFDRWADPARMLGPGA